MLLFIFSQFCQRFILLQDTFKLIAPVLFDVLTMRSLLLTISHLTVNSLNSPKKLKKIAIFLFNRNQFRNLYFNFWYSKQINIIETYHGIFIFFLFIYILSQLFVLIHRYRNHYHTELP